MVEFRPHRQRGIVLPVALVLLVVVSFAGLFAARNSASFEQFSNNLRTVNVARHAAELGLRYCEQAVIDLTDDDSATYTKAITDRILSPATPESDITQGQWNSLSNWADGSANLITVPVTYNANVNASVQLTNAPTCMAELLSDDRFVVTARGLSNDARVDGDGRLTNGSEVWLQSVLKAGSPLTSSTGGIQ